MAKHLPTRPRIVGGLPVLRRQHGELQIGLDPQHAAVVSGLSDTVIATAQRLTGDRTTSDLVACLSPADRAAFTELLEVLHDQGFLEDRGSPPARLAGEVSASEVQALRAENHPIERTGLRISVHGDGRLAVTVACLLAGAGVGWVHVSATGTVQPEDTGTGYVPDDVGTPRLVAARRAVRRVDPTVRTASFDTVHGPDLVLLTDALVPRPEIVDMLTVAAVPHLLVRTRDTIGIVGPLVVPGLTSCLRCADLHRCDRDECWPQVAAQLAGQAQLTDLAGTHATAALAVAQALEAVTWLRDGSHPPASCEVSVELDLRTATVRRRCWSPHEACTCGAAGRRQVDHGTEPKLLRTLPRS